MTGWTYTATIGGIEVDVIRCRVSHGNRLALHEFPKRRGAEGEPGGREPWVADVEVLFFDRPGEVEGAFLERFHTFVAEVIALEEPVTFVHPYEGAQRGFLSGFDHDADGAVLEIRASFRFTEDVALPPVFVAAAGVQVRAGAQDVRADGLATLDELDLLDADLDADTSATARAAVGDAISSAQAWESQPALSTRQVHLELATLNTRLARSLDALEVASDITKHPLMRQLTLLQHTLRRAAAAFTATEARVTTIRVVNPTPLRVLAAGFYGAAQAERRTRDLRDLNPNAASFALIPAGTELKAYAYPDR